ncbi:MAG: hypothetical protein LLG01_07315 [Planctomycetaceae bacterium]|nr:hypothetical protein [Planctomycetaceae bacterium]
MKWLIRSLAAAALTGAFVWAVLAFGLGPRMQNQPALQSFQAVLPPMPEASRPQREPFAPAPTTQQARSLRNPLKGTADELARGKVYYGYYCIFCHGGDGGGTGPVGESYVPTPADLRRPAVQQLGDGELLRRMLTGAGHAPVLERVVRSPQRWPLVLYVRSLAPATVPRTAE